MLEKNNICNSILFLCFDYVYFDIFGVTVTGRNKNVKNIQN
jgi:hypothetical protein